MNFKSSWTELQYLTICLQMTGGIGDIEGHEVKICCEHLANTSYTLRCFVCGGVRFWVMVLFLVFFCKKNIFLFFWIFLSFFGTSPAPKNTENNLPHGKSQDLNSKTWVFWILDLRLWIWFWNLGSWTKRIPLWKFQMPLNLDLQFHLMTSYDGTQHTEHRASSRQNG